MLLCAALAAIVPSSALASGCGSAGDQQYIDPLSNCNGTGTTPPTSTGPKSSTGSSTSPSASTSSSGTPTATTASTTTTTTGTTSTSSKGKDPKSLPYTGLDLAPALIIAFALVGGGLVLRRVAGDERR